MQFTKILIGAALAAILAGGGTAKAEVNFVSNPGDLCGLAGLGGGCEENIQFEQADLTPGLTQTGDTNQTNSPVIFDTNFKAGVSKPVGQPNLGGDGTMQFIVADGLGQGNIICATGGTACFVGPGNHTSQLTSLEIKPGAANIGWGDFEFNPDFGEGTMNVWVADNLGNNFDFALGNGQNFFTLTASDGEVITDVQMTQETGSTGTFGWNDFKQPRVSGVCTLVGATCTPIPTPEPMSIALLGVGLLGLGIAATRRR